MCYFQTLQEICSPSSATNALRKVQSSCGCEVNPSSSLENRVRRCVYMHMHGMLSAAHTKMPTNNACNQVSVQRCCRVSQFCPVCMHMCSTCAYMCPACVYIYHLEQNYIGAARYDSVHAPTEVGFCPHTRLPQYRLLPTNTATRMHPHNKLLPSSRLP